MERPEPPAYYMGIALAVRRRANCRGSRVGALITVGNRIVATGYNGTPDGFTNCLDGGCLRCAQRERFGSGAGYDLCICVHAEQNALLSAARHGIAVAGGELYSSMRPCFGCTKEALQAGIRRVFYLHDWSHPDPELREQYEQLQRAFPDGVERIALADPDAGWAHPGRALPA